MIGRVMLIVGYGLHGLPVEGVQKCRNQVDILDTGTKVIYDKILNGDTSPELLDICLEALSMTWLKYPKLIGGLTK
jgi:hypothetical protein